ncbi:BZ3500_MvSof-1268-A1-R1_Chr3-1g06001 [Microbotryum saponariae]|uniref:BZ3500_MvSof-1268-A1-R1_Chr3-1g06001 protein n=1 Tax=Microbotryum saponariae TaxID=289078 RepID=A0A2X0LSW8_9BASI|nr:BZ3500_MvSof-1268-A1-R1_Chr3-1g06001 [Microbotryum saponariae]SDA05191.1 BZ3501_MvSof-1269-A2-R1_Chr3-1g05671 [Microbotryum saponariae]
MFASTFARSTRPLVYASTRQGFASTSSCAPSCSFSTTCSSFASSSSSTPPSPPSSSTSTRPSTSPATSSDSHLTPSEAELKKVEQRNTTPPPYLSRALGVTNKPSTDPVTREEWKRNLLSKQRRLDERKHLVKQVSKGYFNDYNELRHQGGKKWIAPNTLVREDLSLYFPDIQGVSLANKAKTHTTDLWKGKISLVAIGSFKSSEEHVNSFVRPALSDMKDEPLFQYVYINAQENPLKSFLVTMFLSSLRRQIPVQHQPTYLLSHQSFEYLREPLGMTNKHVGYVYLVDSNGKVRWAGCDWATLNEEEALRKCCHVLVERYKKDHAGAIEGGERAKI